MKNKGQIPARGTRTWGKNAQVKISFGMIVSIILIIAFISIAFYVIGKFLGLQKQIQTGQFLDDLQFDIDKIWKSGLISNDYYMKFCGSGGGGFTGGIGADSALATRGGASYINDSL